MSPGQDPLADIHAHPSFLPWNGDKGPAELWSPHPPRWGQHRWKFTTFSQADLTTLARGNVRLIWASLYPLERGFVDFPRFPGRRWTLDRLARMMMGLSRKRLRFFRSPGYHAFEHLVGEYEYLASEEKVELEIEVEGRRESWSFEIAGNSEDIQRILGTDRKIAVVLSIEGAHSLGSGNPDSPSSTEEFLANIDTLRSTWRHPLFLVTFCHHFDNGLCGHARSIYAPFHRMLDQSLRLDEGFTETGRAVLNRLLGLDGSRPPGATRTLIDLKHMSLAGRWEVYQRVEAHNREHPEDPIPLIVSHFAASGRPEPIPELIETSTDTDELYATTDGLFNPWTLNFSDEEIVRIHESGGLLGLILDQRVLASGQELLRVRAIRESARKRPDPEFEQNWAGLVLNQVRHVVSLCLQSSRPETAWDSLAIGTDFDGKINATDAFPTSAELPRLELQLTRLLEEAPDRDELLMGLDPDVAIRKIFFDNTRDFLGRHFRPESASASESEICTRFTEKTSVGEMNREMSSLDPPPHSGAERMRWAE